MSSEAGMSTYWTDREGQAWKCSAYDHGPMCRQCERIPAEERHDAIRVLAARVKELEEKLAEALDLLQSETDAAGVWVEELEQAEVNLLMASFTVGMRVSDRETGAKGTVTAVTRGTVRVKFDDDEYEHEFHAVASITPSGETWGFPSLVVEERDPAEFTIDGKVLRAVEADYSDGWIVYCDWVRDV